MNGHKRMNKNGDMTRNKRRADGWLRDVMSATGMGVRGVVSELWDGHREETRPLGGSQDARPANASVEVKGNYSHGNIITENPESNWNTLKGLDLTLGRSLFYISVYCFYEHLL